MIDLEVEYRKQKRREFLTAFLLGMLIAYLWLTVYPRI